MPLGWAANNGDGFLNPAPGLDVLYEDQQLLVVNKPANLLSVPGRGPANQDSVQTRAAGLLPQALIVHRLDCATSGVMVLAKTKEAQRELNRQFQERETQKEYHAITHGPCPHKAGKIRFPLITDWPNRPRQKICYLQGKPSLTQFERLSQNGTQNRLKLVPITGRSHQLRVHTMATGMAIVGDRLYANHAVADMSDRLLLHAHTLAIKHPQTGKRVSWQAELPF